MRTTMVKPGTFLLAVLQLFFFLFWAKPNSYASITLTVNGQANGASVVQGAPFNWTVTGLANGAVINNELWIDVNANGFIDPGTDFMFVGFPQRDGVPGGDQGPGDDDATANGTLTSTIAGMYFPVSYYVFKVTSGSESVTSTYQETALTNPTYSVSGRVTQDGLGKANVAVSLQTQNNGEFYALTNSTGYYTITTNLTAGTNVNLRIPIDAFNSQLNGLIATPNDAQYVLNGNLYNVNFTLRAGKIITGRVTNALNNPIPNMDVQIYPNGGGNGYDGLTDGDGRYYISVDTGTYVVRFGSNENTQGYIQTYYNQKYIGWMTDLVQVTLGADTIRNINAVLYRGGVITGTFIKDGVPARGNIVVFDYNNPTTPLYETWHDNNNAIYYLTVPPGNYSVQFNLENGQGQAYYNQSLFSPGTAVTVQSIYDTARNINVNFSTLPKMYTFTGWGDWNNPGNWQNNQLPPSTLPTGDYIVIQNGECTLSGSQTISSGAFLVIRNGSTLKVNGSLIRQ